MTTALARGTVTPSRDITAALHVAITQIQALARASRPERSVAPIRGRRSRIKRGKNNLPRIYFAGCSCCGLVKIGFSRNYFERMQELEQRSGHRGLIVLGTEIGGREEEASTHRRFFLDRVEGEWFRPSADLMAYIREQTIPAGWRGY